MGKLQRFIFIFVGLILWGNLDIIQSSSVNAQVEFREEIKQEADRLFQEGENQYNNNDWQNALLSWQRSLEIYQNIDDQKKEADVLGQLGDLYRNLENYEKSLFFYQKQLGLANYLSDPAIEIQAIIGLALNYDELSQFETAIVFYQAGLEKIRIINDKKYEAYTLANLGRMHVRLGDYENGIEYLQKALEIFQRVDCQEGESFVLRNLGSANTTLDYQKAIFYYEESLKLAKKINNSDLIAKALSALGDVYRRQEKYDESLYFYEQSLKIISEIDDRFMLAIVYADLGRLFAAKEDLNIAILFLKNSINIREQIRANNQGLDISLQKSYLANVEYYYQLLADLLLTQNRIIEAQRVLDLIKVQEINDYFQNVRGNSNTEQGTGYLPAEETLITLNQQRIDKIITDSQTLAALERIPPSELNDSQRQQLITLRQEQTSERNSFRNFLDSTDVQNLLNQLRINLDTNESISINLSQDTQLKSQLQKLQKDGQNAAIIYPLILEDRLEIVIVSANTPPLRHTVPISRKDLNTAILKARQSLTTDPNASPINQLRSHNYQEPLAQLYTLLIQPIEQILKTASIDTLIYAPDGALRYIPLAALYDFNNQKWLIEKYRTNNITALSLTDLDQASSLNNLHLIAGAFPNKTITLDLVTRQESLNGLPFAIQEVETLAHNIPNTSLRLNEQFNRNIIYELNSYDIVHFATHAKFVSGKPWESYIAFGNGEFATLEDVQNWDLSNVDLVVLSACETGVGDILGSGVEILGLGYQMQQRGADATLATLWSVNDQSTQLLINNFYDHLLGSHVTKAEALQQAQLTMLQNKEFTHPYYWASFILIGNGL